MKTFGTKSLSSVIAAVINVIWWLEWATAAGFLLLLTISGFVRGGYVMKLPITFNEINVRQVQSYRASFPDALINSSNGTLSLQVKANSPNVLLLLLGYGIIFACIAVITYQLKIIFMNFKKDLPFSFINVRKIRNIAVVFITYSVVQWLYTIFVNVVLTSNLRWGRIELTYSFDMSYAIMGFMLFIVAEIFYIGLTLEQEQLLTI